MTRVFTIDPGSIESAYCVVDGSSLLWLYTFLASQGGDGA